MWQRANTDYHIPRGPIGVCACLSALESVRLRQFVSEREQGLQMELAAVVGRAEAPDFVAEKARLVYTVLELEYPQFPSDD